MNTCRAPDNYHCSSYEEFMYCPFFMYVFKLTSTTLCSFIFQLSYGIYISMEDYNDQEQKDRIWKDFVSETAKENGKSKVG